MFTTDAQDMPMIDCVGADVEQLNSGIATSDDIHILDEIAVYWFIGHAGVDLQLDLDGHGDFDGVLYLYSQTLDYFEVKDQVRGRGKEQLTHTVDVTDKYCALVSGYQGETGTFDLTLTFASGELSSADSEFVLNTDLSQESFIVPTMQLAQSVPDQCLYSRELIQGIYPSFVVPYDLYYAQIYLDEKDPDRDELTVAVFPEDFDAVVRVYSPNKATQRSNMSGYQGVELLRTEASVSGYYCLIIYSDNTYTGGHIEIHIETH